jgi:hypothetical protein
MPRPDVNGPPCASRPEKKREWFLMCAVYRERAHIHERLIAELSRNPSSSGQRSSQDNTKQGR